VGSGRFQAVSPVGGRLVAIHFVSLLPSSPSAFFNFFLVLPSVMYKQWLMRCNRFATLLIKNVLVECGREKKIDEVDALREVLPCCAEDSCRA